MSKPSRDEAVGVLQDGHRRVIDLVDQLSEEQLVRAATIGGGDWSAKDLVGHLATWEELALQTLSEWRYGKKPSIEDVFAEPDGTGVHRLNAENVQRKRRLTIDEVRERAFETHVVVVREIREMSDEEWNARPFYQTDRRRRLGELLGSVLGAPRRPFGHAFAHIPDLDAYVRSLG